MGYYRQFPVLIPHLRVGPKPVTEPYATETCRLACLCSCTRREVRHDQASDLTYLPYLQLPGFDRVMNMAKNNVKEIN